MCWLFLEKNGNPWLISCQENAVLFQNFLMSIYILQNRIMELRWTIIFSFSYAAS